jgi:hypothetical protein
MLFFSLPLFAQWMVGAASAPINPAKGAFIAGHSHNRRFEGVHDNLYVKAVVISGRGQTMTFLTVDCIGLLYPQLEEIRVKAASKISDPAFPSAQIILSSTHTHAGTDLVGLWGPDLMHSGVDPAYVKLLTDSAASVIFRAWMQREQTRADFSVIQHGEGWVQNISEPTELDRSATTLRFMTKKGRTVASLTNFACHPTFVDAVHNQVSSDYVGGFYARMDSALQGVHLFLQGPIGGWVQPEHEAKTFEQAFFRGRGLADAVMSGLLDARKLKGRGIRFRSNRFNLPLANPGFKALSSAGVIDRQMGDSVLTEVAVFSIGAAQFATHPGETVPAMGLQTKLLMPTKGPKFVLGLSMDAIGYILKPSFFNKELKIPHAEYLCSMSAGPETGPIIMKQLEGLLSSWR